MNTENHSQTAAFLWSIADLLRGDFKQSQYGRIILPFTLLRRMECVLEPTKEAVIRESYAQEGRPDLVRERLLLRAAGQQFFNASKLTLGTLSDTQTAADLMSYVQSFSKDAREIFEHFHFEDFVQQLSAANLLYQVVQRFAATDLSPERISNFGMGIIFEELIRKFAESSNETAGEHFTPRDIVHLTTSLVITGQDDKLKPNSIVTIYDPTAGTGGSLRGRRVHPVHQQAGHRVAARPGAQPRVLCHLQGGHADQGPGRHQHQAGQHAVRRPTGRQPLRLYAQQPAVWRGMEEGPEADHR